MFRRDKLEPATSEASGRFRIEDLHYGAIKDANKRGRNLEDALNTGDAKGWKVVQITPTTNNQGEMIVWDTSKAFASEA
jgi:hypothetical protein